MAIHDELDDVVVPEIAPGIYEHYKGNRYEVVGVALHSETLEPVVVYRPLYETRAPLWVRPYEMFREEIEYEGRKMPRFRMIEVDS